MTPPSEIEAFVAQVQHMRNAQREYFRTRSQTALRDAKRLEAAVDKALAKINLPQKQMFEE